MVRRVSTAFLPRMPVDDAFQQRRQRASLVGREVKRHGFCSFGDPFARPAIPVIGLISAAIPGWTAPFRRLYKRPHIAAVTIPSFRKDLAKLLARAELVTITEHVAACRDPTDDKFLELAVNGHADLIVSGDGDLLALNPFRQIPIITPAIFVQRVAR